MIIPALFFEVQLILVIFFDKRFDLSDFLLDFFEKVFSIPFPEPIYIVPC